MSHAELLYYRLPQVPADAELRPEAVYLHGTDDMSTADVFAYFRVYAPRNIEWINDSSCKCLFKVCIKRSFGLGGVTSVFNPTGVTTFIN